MAEKDDTEGRCPACRTPYDTWEVTTSGTGSPSASRNGDMILALLFVFLVILLQIAWGSTIPFMVTSFLAILMTTPSTPIKDKTKISIISANWHTCMAFERKR